MGVESSEKTVLLVEPSDLPTQLEARLSERSLFVETADLHQLSAALIVVDPDCIVCAESQMTEVLNMARRGRESIPLVVVVPRGSISRMKGKIPEGVVGLIPGDMTVNAMSARIAPIAQGTENHATSRSQVLRKRDKPQAQTPRAVRLGGAPNPPTPQRPRGTLSGIGEAAARRIAPSPRPMTGSGLRTAQKESAPASAAPTAEQASTTKEATLTSGAHPGLRKVSLELPVGHLARLRVALVDDDLTRVDALATRLREAKHEVFLVSGSVATTRWPLLRKFSPHAVIVDEMGIYRDGGQWLTALRSDPYLQRTPLVATPLSQLFRQDGEINLAPLTPQLEGLGKGEAALLSQLLPGQEVELDRSQIGLGRLLMLVAEHGKPVTLSAKSSSQGIEWTLGAGEAAPGSVTEAGVRRELSAAECLTWLLQHPEAAIALQRTEVQVAGVPLRDLVLESYKTAPAPLGVDPSSEHYSLSPPPAGLSVLSVQPRPVSASPASVSEPGATPDPARTELSWAESGDAREHRERAASSAPGTGSLVPPDPDTNADVPPSPADGSPVRASTDHLPGVTTLDDAPPGQTSTLAAPEPGEPLGRATPWGVATTRARSSGKKGPSGRRLVWAAAAAATLGAAASSIALMGSTEDPQGDTAPPPPASSPEKPSSSLTRDLLEPREVANDTAQRQPAEEPPQAGDLERLFFVPDNSSLQSCDELLTRSRAELAQEPSWKAEPLWKKARQQLLMGNREASHQLMCQAAFIDPSGPASVGLAGYYLSQRSHENASYWAAHGIEHRPDHPRKSRELLGDVLNQTGRVKEAKELWLQTMGLDPDDKLRLAKVSRSLVQAAGSARRGGDLALAERLLRRAATLDETNASAAGELAWVLLRDGRRDLARAWADRALALDAEEAVGHLVLGELAQEQNDIPTARKHYLAIPHDSGYRSLADDRLGEL